MKIRIIVIDDYGDVEDDNEFSSVEEAETYLANLKP